MTDPIRYAAIDPAAALRIELEGFTLLYDRRSGQTHILAPPAPELLDALAAGAGDAAALLARLGSEVAAEGDPVAVVAARLDELEAAGLVWRA